MGCLASLSTRTRIDSMATGFAASLLPIVRDVKSISFTHYTSIVCAAILVLFASPTVAAQSDIRGIWVNGDGDGWIELTIEDGELQGKIIGSPDDPENRKPSRLDVVNPDKAMRSRALLGLTILTGFTADSADRWTGGRVYDPNSGKTYRGTLTVIDSATLKLRGFIGISLFGRTEFWRRRVVH